MVQEISKAVMLGSFVVAAIPAMATDMTDAEIENLVRRSYQYVAMFNVNNKFALTQGGL